MSDGWTMEWSCKKCGRDFEAKWLFGDDVTCAHCGTVWHTDWDYGNEDSISAWLADEVPAPEREGKEG